MLFLSLVIPAFHQDEERVQLSTHQYGHGKRMRNYLIITIAIANIILTTITVMVSNASIIFVAPVANTCTLCSFCPSPASSSSCSHDLGLVVHDGVVMCRRNLSCSDTCGHDPERSGKTIEP